jgi:hypothetical protein
MTAPTRRVSHGRGHSYFLDGQKAIGVTTAISEGYPKPALVGWAAKATAGYAIDHWDEIAEMGIAERIRTLENSRFAERDAAANRGTDVHTFALELAAGEEVVVPEVLTGHVDSYLQFAEEWQPKEKLTEVVVVNRRWRYMGTLDLVTDLADGKTWLLDMKTNKSGVFAESALQLAGYRHCETYLGADGEEHPMPAVDRCGVIWLRADGYDLIPIEAGDAEFRIFLYALELARWRDVNDNFKRREDCEVIGEALTPPAREVAA